MSNTRTFKIYRYDQKRTPNPYMQTITIELDGSERMLLDADEAKGHGPQHLLPPLMS